MIRASTAATLAVLAAAFVLTCGIALRAPLWSQLPLAASVVAAGAWWWRRQRDVRFPTTRSETYLRLWLFTLLCAGIVITIAQPVVEFDAVAIWYPKARAFLVGMPFDRWPFPMYPPLGSVLWGLPLLITGPEYEAVGRSVFIAFYIAWAASLREYWPRPLTPIPAIAIGVVALAALDQRHVTSGFQDPLLAAVAGIAAMFLAVDLNARRHGSATIGLATAGILGLIKVEGLILGSILAGLWLLFRLWCDWKDRAPMRLPWIGIALFAAGSALWPLVARIYGVNDWPSWVPPDLGPATVVAGFDRLPIIFDRFLQLRPTVYLPVAAALILIAFAWAVGARARVPLAWLASVAAVYTAATIGLFLITTAPLDWHLSTLFTRMIGQQLMLWYLMIVIAVTDVHASSAAGS